MAGAVQRTAFPLQVYTTLGSKEAINRMKVDLIITYYVAMPFEDGFWVLIMVCDSRNP